MDVCKHKDFFPKHIRPYCKLIWGECQFVISPYEIYCPLHCFGHGPGPDPEFICPYLVMEQDDGRFLMLEDMLDSFMTKEEEMN